MPLLDHFHPPLSNLRHWEAFHSAWAGSIADLLNRDLLPAGYFAEEHIHVGSRVEVDVATFDATDANSGARGDAAIAVTERPWVAPPATLTWPAIFPDSLEVLVSSSEAGPTLVAAIELVSPGNKDRPEYRRAFAAKCAAYLQQGVGLLVIDIVTNRLASMQRELADLLGAPAADATPGSLYAFSCRSVRRSDEERIDVWSESLAIGKLLPILPLALDKAQTVPINLEATYTEACQRRRIAEAAFPRLQG